jgi:hypothetical protein
MFGIGIAIGIGIGYRDRDSGGGFVVFGIKVDIRLRYPIPTAIPIAKSLIYYGLEFYWAGIWNFAGSSSLREKSLQDSKNRAKLHNQAGLPVR